jgi:hypothetical protein
MTVIYETCQFWNLPRIQNNSESGIVYSSFESVILKVICIKDMNIILCILEVSVRKPWQEELEILIAV